MSWSPASKPTVTPPTEAQDEQLLENMQVALEREAPMALEPAEVLTKEMSRARNVASRSRQGAR
jgi:hypothetical protein